jgi:hypothetical protein
MSDKIARAIKHAQRRAKEMGEAWAVVELDSDDMEDRVIRCMPLEATEDDEFLAWEGKILYIIERDGSYELRSFMETMYRKGDECT